MNGENLTHCSADLEVESPNGRAVVHCVECSDLVHSHGWHLQYPTNFIHDADTGEAMLALTEIEKGHYGCLLVLWWVSFEDFGDKPLVNGIEFERYGRVVNGTVSMLYIIQREKAYEMFEPVSWPPINTHDL